VLSIVSTPIGNLGDITLRALETLKACDIIVCEDTRVTGVLLKHFEIPKKELISLHGYSDPHLVDRVIAKLLAGAKVVLVSDAGTPGISDPGYALVSRARAEGILIEVIPGPSAFLAALSASGLPINKFLYLGFLPLKKGRKRLLATFAEEDETIVFYESVHRIERTLSELAEALASQPDRDIVIARELTKMHEEVVRTTVAGLADASKKIVQKGEFVVVVGPMRKRVAMSE
jgi:16S rRNA (cytidine1402-2'-O)-methyltransferase